MEDGGGRSSMKDIGGKLRMVEEDGECRLQRMERKRV